MSKILFAIIIILFIWSFFIEPHLLVTKHYKVKSLEGTRIVFVSDFHISKWDKGRLERVVKLINKQKPDLVLSGGDFIKGHDGKNTLSIEEQAAILSKIEASFVTVLGNHDGWYDKERVAETLKNSGFTVLLNSNIKIDGLSIAGVDVYYDVKEDVDLILSGHTHGGQVSFPIIGAPVVPSEYGSKMAKREINETQNRMIITKGLGTSILPIRFGAVPEIVVIN